MHCNFLLEIFVTPENPRSFSFSFLVFFFFWGGGGKGEVSMPFLVTLHVYLN